MSRAVRELRQIPFEHLIGAPLKSAVEAQALAAQSTIEFIQKVGFKSQNNYDAADMLFVDPSKDADAGELRNITFKYKKKNENEGLSDFQLTVPLLSIAPIPYIRIEEMTIDFSAKLTDVIERKTSTSFKLDSSVSGNFSAWWSPIKSSVRVSSTYSSDSSARAASKREYRMDIHVRAIQDEMPGGLSKILDMLEDAIQDQKTSTTSTSSTSTS